ncbi:MAG TPA: hypothetical protein VGJ61_07725 [Solirubrobacterales bacterium]
MRDLQAALVGELALGLDRHLVGARHETGVELGGGVEQLMVA